MIYFLSTIAVLTFFAGLAFSIAAMERDPNTGKRTWHSRFNQAVILVTASLGLFFANMVRQNLNIRLDRNGATEAIRETANIDIAITKILSDAGKSSLHDLFEPVAFQRATADYMTTHNANLFEASTALYTSATYSLLHNGRDTLTLPDDDLDPTLRDIFDESVVRLLGTSYMSTLGPDPWGNDYRVFAGPWPEAMGPVLLRCYFQSSEITELPGAEALTEKHDSLTTSFTGDIPGYQGIPAPARMDIYIWSLGKNEVSDQPRYDPTHAYAPPARSHYRKDATDKYLGGGDDINNWDTNQSFMWHYN